MAAIMAPARLVVMSSHLYLRSTSRYDRAVEGSGRPGCRSMVDPSKSGQFSVQCVRLHKVIRKRCAISWESWAGSLEQALGDDDDVTRLQHHILGLLALDDVANAHLDALLLAIDHPDEACPVRCGKCREAT